MSKIRVSVNSVSGQFVVLDDSKNLATTITKEVIKDEAGSDNPSEQDVEDFYNLHINIAEKNQSKFKNENGYFESSITTVSNSNGN